MTSSVFIAHGTDCPDDDNLGDVSRKCTRTTNSGTRGLSVTVDIQGIMASKIPDCGDSDYYSWQPPTANQCVFGRSFKIGMRKPDSLCFNGRDYSINSEVGDPCDCDASADFACEPSYFYSPSHDKIPGKCVKDERLKDKGWCPILDDRTYVESSVGYRLLPGDECKDVGKVVPDTDGAGHSRSGDGSDGKKGGHGFFYVLLMTILVFAAVGASLVACIRLQQNDDLLAKLASSCSVLADRLVALWDTIRIKLGLIQTPDDYFTPLHDDLGPSDYQQPTRL